MAARATPRRRLAPLAVVDAALHRVLPPDALAGNALRVASALPAARQGVFRHAAAYATTAAILPPSRGHFQRLQAQLHAPPNEVRGAEQDGHHTEGARRLPQPLAEILAHEEQIHMRDSRRA